MPFDSKKYPANWKEFSLEIRNGRAKGRCEECRVRNYAVGYRKPDGSFHYHGGNAYLDSVSHGFDGYKESLELYQHLKDDFNGGWEDERPTMIVLTVAHLDQEGGICDCYARTGMKCTIGEHVKALCQKCHLALDMPKHIANRRETIAGRNDAARPLLGEI